MRKLFLIFALMPLFLFNNCSDNDSVTYIEPSNTEIIAKKLQELITERNITYATVYILNPQENIWVREDVCNGLEVSDPYIKVCRTYYLLSNLVEYKPNNSELELYFKY